MYLQQSELTQYGSKKRPGESPSGVSRSFLLHIRPRRYPQASLRFNHTFYLGFWTTFLFAVEIVTGVLLMLYYVPTPEGAYQSIQRLAVDIPFGQLFRDLHRLAGDLLVIVAVLHLLRVAVSGTYGGNRRFTWLSGMVLLALILTLAFSGYLLPWDQLAYWAVTVGTSLVHVIPLIGEPLQQVLRGGMEIGGDGLLRFYVMHVLVLPGMAILFLAIHYYRLVRLHGISLPCNTSSPHQSLSLPTISFWPEVAVRELALIIFGLTVLLVITGFVYDAPLAAPANPLHTPNLPRAPWFFLWIQGLLSIGLPAIIGLILPTGLFLLVMAYPYLAGEGRRPIKQKPRMLAALAVVGLILVFLSYLGSHEGGPDRQSPESIFNSVAPEDGGGPLHVLPYDALTDGVYPLIKPLPSPVETTELAQVIATVNEQLEGLLSAKLLSEASGFLIIEPWQAGMKRITLRIGGAMPGEANRQNFERKVFRYDSVAKDSSGRAN